MFPVAAIAGAGWLLLFIVLLIAPPSPGPHEGGGPGEGGGDGLHGVVKGDSESPDQYRVAVDERVP